MRIFKISIVVISTILFSCSKETKIETKIISPNSAIEVIFNLTKDGQPNYTISYKKGEVIKTSTLGFDLREAASLKDNFKIINVISSSFNETWKMPWGEQLEVVNNYNELKIELQETSELKRKLNITFRVYDDGLGFRYEFPEQKNLSEVFITEENTEFKLTADHKVWWIPGDWDIYEHLYNTTQFSEIDAIEKAAHVNLAQTSIPENAVNTPVTMKTKSGLHLSFHEASLIDYSGMTLQVDTLNFVMKSNLVGSDNLDYKVKRTVPFHTPWRTIQIAEKASDLIESNLIVNLNEPSKLDDISWFKPTKYTGIWWEMHLGKSSWDLASGKHGATTENAKAFIDFSAKNNIGAVLVEGWNTGWEHWIGFEDREGVFDFVTPYSDYDLKEVVRYGKEKGVEIIMHHETSAATETYEKQQDTAYALMQSLGIHSVKTGYVGKILPKGEYHHGQYMVNQYNNAVIKAAKYQVAINAHEPIKATGLRRTYPNTISREGLRGQEFNAWAQDGGNPPEHLSIVAFTRMLAGPIDFTPGIFDIKFDKYKTANQVNTTIAQQLALYVVIYSPVQMAADLIENYEGNPALQFIRDVGVDWQQTKVLNGEIGDFVTIARQERNSNNWFVGGITDENSRTLVIDFSFLEKGVTYEATIYEDGKDAHWDKNPTSLTIRTIEISNTSKEIVKLAEGGGFAISLLKK
ncbi:MAG: glycoside hydrolase family 97 protein [Lutibacter sp.]|uniref:glycoside hydrolase family 97 protein n=1 Tax=Lutibacter sp. TaxID=1925666 RepID=UPI00181A99EF|nr:glycoside hydrolase family 97 protein [Lutibacter sp.]MBT8316584.1 glycoside hydrolase family 97 protein [Lutibacter sp.]NNJ57444.1 glycoside hydrolase family 97 protein [Lutibacter sp.]